MPFQQLDEWQKQAQLYVKTASEEGNGATPADEQADEPA